MFRGRIQLRKKINKYFLKVGDILLFSYEFRGLTYLFKGLCVAVRNKNVKKTNRSVVLRGFVSGSVVDLFIAWNSINVELFERSFSLINVFSSKSKLWYVNVRQKSRHLIG